MELIVFDSFALICLFKKESGYEKVSELLLKCSRNEAKSWISAINVGEVYYMISRKLSPAKAEIALQAILQFPITIEEVSLKTSLEAAKLKASYKMSYADAFAASLAINKKAVLVTGDKEFITIKEDGFEVQFI